MKNQLEGEQVMVTAGSGSLAGFLPVPDTAPEVKTPKRTAMEELQQARLEALQANAKEEVAWIWLAASALVLIGLSFLL